MHPKLALVRPILIRITFVVWAPLVFMGAAPSHRELTSYLTSGRSTAMGEVDETMWVSICSIHERMHWLRLLEKLV